MDALVNSTLLSPRYLLKVIDDIPSDTATYRGGEMMSLITKPGPLIEWDIRKPLGGMTQAVARGAESPLVHRRGVGQKSFEPGHFREKTVLGESDVTTLRKLGTLEERAKAAELVAEILVDLNSRLDTRIEWLRWEPIINNSVTINSNKVQYTVNYYLPTRMRPTASPLWSTVATADPITDIQTWVRLARGTGGKIKQFWYNSKVEQYLMQNARMLSLIDRVVTGGNLGLMGKDILDSLLRMYIGNYPTQMYDAGYNMVTYLTSSLTAGQTSLTVDDASVFEANDTLVITDPTEIYEESDTVSSTTLPGTIVVGTGFSNTYAANSMVRAYKTFLPDNVFIIELEFPPGSGDKGEIISVDSVYGRGSLTNPVPGKFAETLFITKDPKQIEIIVGINALGVIYRQRGWIVATIA